MKPEKIPPHLDPRPGADLLKDARFMRGLYKSIAKQTKDPVFNFKRMG